MDMNMANETKLSTETVKRRKRSQFNGHSLPHQTADNSFTDSTSFSTPQGDLTNTPNTTMNDYSAPQSYFLGFGPQGDNDENAGERDLDSFGNSKEPVSAD
ncbi:uncharacterized protein LOC124418524 [Lucilia cuprina]|uniref:uncharacterized protein LOC124418524 n=1 Tax=Lucilia cuprina TaxID=7375 RepID=UPI001F06B0CA|nr:uncharacterized protein LOC124418524 [Lucilia cuprina]